MNNFIDILILLVSSIVTWCIKINNAIEWNIKHTKLLFTHNYDDQFLHSNRHPFCCCPGNPESSHIVPLNLESILTRLPFTQLGKLLKRCKGMCVNCDLNSSHCVHFQIHEILCINCYVMMYKPQIK